MPSPPKADMARAGTLGQKFQPATGLAGTLDNSMNYYNEFDPKSAAWLRELISNPIPPVNISSYQAARGTSGKAPKPFPATCNFSYSSIGRYARFRACGQRPKLESLRSSRTNLGQMGYAFGIVSSLNLEAASLLFAGDKLTPFRGFSCATLARTSLPWPSYRHPSMSTFDFDLVVSEKSYRNCGTYARLLDSGDLPISTLLRILENKTRRLFSRTDGAFRIACTVFRLAYGNYKPIAFICK